MRILMVDDDPKYRELIKKYLLNGGIQSITIDESSDMASSIQMIKDNNYDAMLLDLYLPDTEGIATIQKMINNIKTIGKNIPIIVLTGYEDYSIGRKAFDMGIREFLIKDEIKEKEINIAIDFATYKNPLEETLSKAVG